MLLVNRRTFILTFSFPFHETRLKALEKEKADAVEMAKEASAKGKAQEKIKT